MVVSSETEAGTPRTAGRIMGFSPKILVALIALGVIAASSIVFNVYFLTTKDTLKTEVEGLKESKGKLEIELGAARKGKHDELNDEEDPARRNLPDQDAERDRLGNEENLARRNRPDELPLEEENANQKIIAELRDLLNKTVEQNEKLKKTKTELKNKLEDISAKYDELKKTGEPADTSLSGRPTFTEKGVQDLRSKLTTIENQNKVLEADKTRLVQELESRNLAILSEEEKSRQEALLLKQQLDDQKNSLDSQGRVLDGVKRQNESLLEQLKKKSNDMITLLAESGDESGFKSEIVQLKSSLDELQVEVERRKSAENELRLKFENELEKIKMSNNTLAVERSDMESSLLKSESDKKLLQKENTRLSLELQNTIQKVEEAQLRSVECINNMQKMEEKLGTIVREIDDLNNSLTNSEQERNSLQKELTELTLKSDKLERGDLQKLKDDIAKINNTNQELSGRLSIALAENNRSKSLLDISDRDKNELLKEVTGLRSELMSAKQLVAEMSVKQDDNQKLEKRPPELIQPISRDKSPEALRAENPKENKPITVESENTFNLLVNNLIEDMDTDKTSTKSKLVNFVKDHPKILNLSPGDLFEVGVVERRLFDYFNLKFMKLAGNKSSKLENVIKLRDCVLAFDSTSRVQLESELKKYFFLVLDDLICKTEFSLFEISGELNLAHIHCPKEEIFSRPKNETHYVILRLGYYYQTYYDNSSDLNQTHLEEFFDGIKRNFHLFRLVPSAHEMFRLHMERLLIEGILDNNYDSTLLSREKCDLLKLTLNSVEDFKPLLIRHLNPMISPSGEKYVFETSFKDFSKKCVRFINLLWPSVLIGDLKANNIYILPDLKPPKLNGVRTILNSYEKSFEPLTPLFLSLDCIFKLFSLDFKKLNHISSEFDPKSSSYNDFNENICNLHNVCIRPNMTITGKSLGQLISPSNKVLRGPFFEILYLDKFKDEGVPEFSKVKEGYLRRLTKNHLDFLNLEKDPRI